MNFSNKLATLSLFLLGIGSPSAFAEGETARPIGMTCIVIETDTTTNDAGDSHISGVFFMRIPLDLDNFWNSDKYHEFAREIANTFQREIGVSTGSSACDSWDEPGLSRYTPEEYFADLRSSNERESRLPPGYPKRMAILTEWTPSEELKQRITRRFFGDLYHEEHAGKEDLFTASANGAVEQWRLKNGLSKVNDVTRMLTQMVQMALILQNFEPGPTDGVFGKRTLAAIVAWRTMHGLAEGAGLVEVIAAILHAALVLEGYDPGPVEEIFGPSAIEAVQAWAPSYEKAARNQGSRDRNDRLSPPTSWRTVPHAKDCVSFVGSGGAGNYKFIRNDCDFKIDVHWCYTDRPGDNDYCAPGRAGIGYMDRVGHRATRRGAGPDYYTSSEGLRPREITRQPMRLGAIRYIACGHRPLRNAQQYVTEWDAHTAKFRCLAYAPEQDDRTPAEGTAE